MSDSKIKVPADGQKITMGADGRLQVPERPIVPFIEGDGTGPDITRAAMVAWNAAVEKAYGGTRRVEWMEIFAGEKANEVYGANTWLPAETLTACRDFLPVRRNLDFAVAHIRCPFKSGMFHRWKKSFHSMEK